MSYPKDYRASRKAREKTLAAPGSPEKVQVMAGRLRDGEELWHPGDPVITWERGTRDGILIVPSMGMDNEP